MSLYSTLIRQCRMKTDQDTRRGVMTSNSNVRMDNSMGSLQEGKKGYTKIGKIQDPTDSLLVQIQEMAFY